MTSRQTFECYVCKRQGFADVRVFLDGKTEDGKTIYKNPDMTPHQHKQQSQAQQQPKQTDYDKSVDNGISAFSMMTNLILLVEQTQKSLVTLNEKVEHLTKLVYALSQQKQQHDHHDQNPHTLLDNR